MSLRVLHTLLVNTMYWCVSVRTDKNNRVNGRTLSISVKVNEAIMIHKMIIKYMRAEIYGTNACILLSFYVSLSPHSL